MGKGYLPNDKRNYFIANMTTIWLARLLSDDPVEVFDDPLPVGDVQSASMTPELTELEHFTNFAGLDAKDHKITIRKAEVVKVEINELVLENLQYAVLGSTPDTATIYVPHQETKSFAGTPGTLQVNSGAPIYDILGVYNLDGTAYDEGPTNDYTVTEGTGTITRVGGGSIALNEKVKIHYRVTHTTQTRTKILGDPNQEARAWIVSAGQEAGPRRYIYIPRTRVAPDGDINLLPKDAWNAVTLKLELLEDATDGFGYWYNY